MHLPLKFLSLTATTLLVSLGSPRPLIGITLDGVASDSQAQTTGKYGQTVEDARANTKLRSNIVVGTDAGTRDAPDAEKMNVLRMNATWYNFARTEELQNSHALAADIDMLASAYQSQASMPNEYQKATRAAISSLTTAWRNKDRDSEAKALATLGSVYSLRRENRNAIVFAQQGLKVAEENNVPSAAASSLLTLAGVQLQERDYSKVIAFTEQGRNYLQKLQEHDAEGAALVVQGLANLGQENYQQSIELTQQGLAISQDVKNPLIEALGLIVLSLDYSNSGEFQKAVELINKSRRIAHQQNNPNLEALTLEVRGEIYRQEGQKEQAMNSIAFRSAIASYQEALSIQENFSAFAGLARVYQDANLMETAITYYKQAVNKNEEQIPRHIPGLPIWLQESFPQAIQDINGLQTTEVYRLLAKLLLPEKRRGEAQQVLELLKGQELREYTGDKTINTSVSGQPATLTITPTEQQIIKEYGSLIKFGEKFDECQQARCQDMESLSQQRDVLTEKYYQTLGQLETEIRNKSASDEAFIDPGQFAIKAKEIVESQPNTVLIYPLVLDNKLWLLWASKGGIFKSLEITDVSQSKLEETVLKFRQLLQNRVSNIDELKTTGKQLYDWLIKPLESELKANNIHNLVFALDRSTRYVPMGTLFDGQKYLIENYSISTVLSANLTATRSSVDDPKFMRSSSKSSNDHVNDRLGVVNRTESDSPRFPVGTSRDRDRSSTSVSDSKETTVLALGVSDAVGGFPPLPNVPTELDGIVRHDSAETRGVYPGQEFLNQAFDFFTLRDNAPAHQLLHIATHSKFAPGPANQSYLLLGTGEKLEAPEIETWLNLQGIDLVALSACQTALGGPGLDGREIAGVGYYFLKSGAKTVMASLWSVDDRSTSVLMELFYKNLSKGTAGSPVMKAEALRQAQLTLLYGRATAEAPTPSSVKPTGTATDSRDLRSPLVQQQDNSLPAAVTKNFFSHPYYWAPFILMGNG